jgi:hypothetical protein
MFNTRDHLPDDRRLVKEWGAFLSQFHWQVFVTPTFKKLVTRSEAKVAITKWIREMGEDVYAYVAYEEGTAGGRTHCHALLGGLPTDDKERTRLHLLRLCIHRAEWSWTWKLKRGEIKIDRYDPTRGAAWYVAKFPADGEIIGTMKRHTGHRKRRKRPVPVTTSHEDEHHE